MEQIITGLVRNQPGVLALIADLFKELNINIRSLVVAETEREEYSSITIVADSGDGDLSQLANKLSAVIEIEKMERLGLGDHYERELVLIRIAFSPEQISTLMQIAELFHAHMVGVGEKTVTLELVAESSQVQGFIQMLEPYSILAIARTGRTALKKEDD